MMTNSEIVSIVENKYNLKKLVNKLYYRCPVVDDFIQEIYLHLMNMNNEKINKLYKEKGALKGWIIRVIINQRNNGNMVKPFIIKDTYNIEEVEIEDDIQHDLRLEFLDEILDEFKSDYDWFEKQEGENLRLMMAIEILKLYYLKEKQKIEIICQFSIGISTLNTLLKEGKLYIKEMFEKKYQLFLENKLSIWK